MRGRGVITEPFFACTCLQYFDRFVVDARHQKSAVILCQIDLVFVGQLVLDVCPRFLIGVSTGVVGYRHAIHAFDCADVDSMF